MKKRITALFCAAALLLTGCSSMLERESVSVTLHNSAPSTDGSPSILKAGSYQELVNALVYLVDQGQETGTIRVYTDKDDVAGHLEDACLELIREDPLGAYAVNHISYEISPLVTCSEADVTIDYRRTPQQIASVVPVTGTTAIRAALKEAMNEYAPEAVLRIGYFDRDPNYFLSLARQAFYDDPVTALDYPDMDMAIYPDKGRRRIVELSFTYHLSRDELAARESVLKQELVQLARTVPFSAGIPFILSAADALLLKTSYDPEGGSTAWHALTDHTANNEGLTLAFACLCQELKIPFRVAEGTLEGSPRFWTIVSTPEGWRHIDLTRSEELLTDAEAKDIGYRWDAASLPKCAPPIAN